MSHVLGQNSILIPTFFFISVPYIIVQEINLKKYFVFSYSVMIHRDVKEMKLKQDSQAGAQQKKQSHHD